MGIKKSQKKLSEYRSHMRIREGLSFSDYFDDSIPNEVKPVYSLTSMQEDEGDYIGNSDIPTQSKDLFKGLWEDVLSNGHNYWMNPKGQFLRVNDNHIDWAIRWLSAHQIPFTDEDTENGNIYEMMFDRQFIRVKVFHNEIYVVFNPDRSPTNLQWRNLKDAAIESGMRLIDGSGSKGYSRKEIELQEGSRILVKGSNYWLDPESNFQNVDIDGHARWAIRYLDEKSIRYDKLDTVYPTMFKLGFIRVRTNDDMMFFQYDKFKSPTNLQIRTLKDSAIESGLELYDDVQGMTVPLNESIKIDVKRGNKTLFIESMMPDDLDTFKSHLGQLFAYLQKELQLKTIPKVKLVSDDKNSAKVLGKTAYYDPDNKTVVLYTTDRHQKDVLRSFAHEIIHHWQHENERLQTSKTSRKPGESDSHDPQYAQKNPWLRQMEKQAYLLGNMCFRDWEDQKKANDRKSGKKMVEMDQQPTDLQQQQIIRQIPPETPYGVIDGQTKKVVFKTTYAHRNRARRFADKKDLEYGAHRYVAMVLRGDYLKERTTLIGKEYPPKKTDYSG